MYISLFFLHLGFLYWQYRNWSSDEAEHPNYQNQNIKYQNSSISFSTHLFGLILKEGLSSKAITLFQACVYSKLFHAFRDFLYCFHIFQTLNIRSVFIVDYLQEQFLISFKCLWPVFVVSQKVCFFRLLWVAVRHMESVFLWALSSETGWKDAAGFWAVKQTCRWCGLTWQATKHHSAFAHSPQVGWGKELETKQNSWI